MSEFDSELYFRVAFFAFLIPLGSADCVDLDLGMENERISDGNITASSIQNASTPAKNGRLNYTSGSSWCARPNDTNPYLQIDLQTLYIICAVSTQGNSQADHWVKNYTLQFSNNGSTWMVYRENGQIKTFKGNGDRASEVKHVLYEIVQAHYLRIYPSAYHGAVCMRIEVFGVKRKPVNVALGKATLQSSTFNNTDLGVSGVSGVAGKAVDGNSDTEFRNGGCAHTEKGNASWWRVDLGSDNVSVSDIFIVNRFSTYPDVMARSKNYSITLGNNPIVVNNTQCRGLYSFVNFGASAVCYTNPLITGRYVGISNVGKQALQLCEVEIYLRDNLAFGKQTNQSSVWNDSVSSRAVDGISNTDYYANSCTRTDKELNPWWRVDLGQNEQVSEIYLVNQEKRELYRQNNFEIRVGTVSNNGGITNPRCGDNQSYSLPRGKGVSFFCRPVLIGRYVTIKSLRTDREHFTLCEVEVYSERRACQMQAIGVASNYTLPDACFSASTEGEDLEAFRGRLNALRGWSPSKNNKLDDYLQIDLQYEFLICAIATQGRSTSDDWTKEYKLQLSLDGSTFVTYKESNVDKTFSGNSGRHDIVKHNLRDVRARFVRFQPVKSFGNKALRVEVYGVLISRVPSQAPSEFTLSATSSASITASWQLPPAYSRHGIIVGFKLFYKKKGLGSMRVETINCNGGTTFSAGINGLDNYTEYEFQVLAFTSHGDGPKSFVVVERTLEIAPGPPASLNHTLKTPTESYGPMITLSWTAPSQPNVVIRNYTVFYHHSGDLLNAHNETFGPDVFNYTVDVLGGATYWFNVRAETIKPGENASLIVNIPEYKPNSGPAKVFSSFVDKTTLNISWAPLPREQSNGGIILYNVKEELLSRGTRQKRSPLSGKTVNTTDTFILLSGLLLCLQYQVSVRAYTKVGPGPYGPPLKLPITSGPGTPWGLNASNVGATQVTLEWKEPELMTKEGFSYRVKYFGTKPYNGSFREEGVQDVGSSTHYTIKGLVPGSFYEFQIFVSSVCGLGEPRRFSDRIETKMTAPIPPAVLSVTNKRISTSTVVIQLWPAEQRNGPISSYQVLVLNVVDGVEDLPIDFASKMIDSNSVETGNLNFYVAAEIENFPGKEMSWEFSVGDGKTYGAYRNKELKIGEDYIVYQRAMTYDNDIILDGPVSKVAKISVLEGKMNTY